MELDKKGVDGEPPSSDKGTRFKCRVADRDIRVICSLLIGSGKVGVWARRAGYLRANQQCIK